MQNVRIVGLLAWLCLAVSIAWGHEVSIPLIGQANDVAAINGDLAKPEGVGPFPAVVLLHGCGGLSPAVRQRAAHWVRLYRQLGYVTLVLDSMTPRGWRGCRRRDPNSRITITHRVVDAYSALAFLSEKPFVDQQRVVLEGMSHGGRAVLRALTRDDPTGQRGEFAAGIAFYPLCKNLVPSQLRAPLLVLIGAEDGTTPAAACPRPVSSSIDYRLQVYTDATHGYDVDLPGRYFREDYREFNSVATADSAKHIQQFLATHVAAAGK